jgi:hypothetical protein
MNWIGDSAEAIKDNAGTILKWSVIALLGIGTFYIVVKDPRVIGRWITLPVDAAKGIVKATGTAVNTGANAVMVIPNAILGKRQ